VDIYIRLNYLELKIKCYNVDHNVAKSYNIDYNVAKCYNVVVSETSYTRTNRVRYSIEKETERIFTKYFFERNLRLNFIWIILFLDLGIGFSMWTIYNCD